MVLFLISVAGLAKWIDWFAAGWLVAILLTAMFAPDMQVSINPPLATLLLSSMNVAFAAGLLLPRLMRVITFWPLALMIGVPLIAIGTPDDRATLKWTGGLSCVLFVGAAAQLPQIKNENWFSRLAVRFGEWSYVTYLVHCTVFWLLFQAFAGY
ncbi:hypothetical protein [Phyllobacterium lublinensis]|uniref:hypothetical protein n=1 Tax=Phyllobacterium lublinensis TaxID=2875708 RepID=UPI001CCFA279|nr:hypothetical protein [Phyllobacterium sp. 2063]MBZ9656088.1 hypothetical protein [Phyllobacterium sp. 2063]